MSIRAMRCCRRRCMASAGLAAVTTLKRARSRRFFSREATPGSSSTMRMVCCCPSPMATSQPLVFAGHLDDSQEHSQAFDRFNEFVVADRLGHVDVAAEFIAALHLTRVIGGR